MGRSIILFCCLFLAAPLMAEDLVNAAPTPAPKIENAAVVDASFKNLQRLMYSRETFTDPQNEKEISTFIDGFRGGVHTNFIAANQKFSADPGFSSTIKVLNQMLDDARLRFAEGKKGYALWRLKTAWNYCVACHTRHDVPTKSTESEVDLSKLNKYEEGEYYLAARQFDKAKGAFIAAVLDPSLSFLRMDALRKWLIVYVRVYPDPQAAISQINKLRPRAKFSRYEEDEIIGWLESLRRWQNEGELRVSSLAKAENLLRQGLGMNDPLSQRKGTVELLRATAVLHRILEDLSTEALPLRSHALYLLGLAYSELPFFFMNELPELFLEQVIREYPGSEDSRNAFRLYREIITLGYTGSGGTRLPEDAQTTLRELHDLAYGSPTIVRGKV